MNGLVNRSIQQFLTHTHGSETWLAVTRAANLEITDFEAMLSYSDGVTPALIQAAASVLDRSRAELLEDFGSFLVLHPSVEAVRRLLRFGGTDFVDFLHSLDDLADRVRLALPKLNLPDIELHPGTDLHFMLVCDGSLPDYGHVMVGALRGIADDYGVLALVDHVGAAGGREMVQIRLIDRDFTQGRHFDLAGRVA